MNVERDQFRIDLRSAKLCMELDCNTIFDAARYRDCPTCGSVEFYPLETWLNRERAEKAPALRGAGTEPVGGFKSVARATWLERVRGTGSESDVPVGLRVRAVQRRRAG